MNPTLHALILIAAFIGGGVIAEVEHRMRRRRWVRSTLESQLRAMRDYAQARIDAGDLDLDGVVYPTRNACTTLLDLHFGGTR